MTNIKDIKELFLKASYHYSYQHPKTHETEKTEAFLIQCTLLEGVLYNLALKNIEKRFTNLYKKREKYYSLDNIISDLFLIKIISKEDFKKLEEFKHDRNKYFHSILKNNSKIREKELGEKYSLYKTITWKMIEKLENQK
ncbi:MAG: hypothetical protein PHO23_00475 [Candidatus Pacebacteria bacterium]|nr:hypothetical protein [Candidatus Paceibacterota bacterium]